MNAVRWILTVGLGLLSIAYVRGEWAPLQAPPKAD